MFQELIAEFSNTLTSIAAIFAVICLVPSRAFKLLQLYDNHGARRHYKLLKELRTAENLGDPFANYLDEALYLESFRIASGVQANRLKADFLVRLALTGQWDRRQIRQIARYLVTRPGQSKLTLRIKSSDAIGAWLSRILGVTIVLGGSGVGLAVMLKGNSFSAFLAGMGIQTLFIVGAVLITSPHDSYYTARRFQLFMKDHLEFQVAEDAR